MEKNLNELKTTNDIILAENNDANTVTRIYDACNGSKLFESSRSFIQTQLNDQSSLNFSKLTEPNFCELDIIAKNEKVDTAITFLPLQTTSAKLKGLNKIVSKIPHENRMFRKTSENVEEVNQKSGETLNLEKQLKNSDSISGGIHENHANIENLMKNYKIEKRRDVKHKLIKGSTQKHNEQKNKDSAVNIINPIRCTSFIDNKEIVQKYDNLVHAKTMYFADLPNKIKTKQCNFGVDIGKDGVGTKEKTQKNPVAENKSKNNAIQTMKKVVETNCISESIIINKIEDDISQWSSVNSQSTSCTARGRTFSGISINDSIYSNKKSNSKRIHNNSPINDVTVQEIMENTDKQSRKRKRKKRHENSRKTTTDEEDKNKLKIRISKFSKSKVKKDTQKISIKDRSIRKICSASNVAERCTKSEKDSSEVKNDKRVLNIFNKNVQKKQENHFNKDTSEFEVTKSTRGVDNRTHSKKQKYSRPVARRKQTDPEGNSSETENEYHRNAFKGSIDTEEINREFKISIMGKREGVGTKKFLRKRNHSWCTGQLKNSKPEVSSTVSKNEYSVSILNERGINENERNDYKQAGLKTNGMKTNNAHSDGVLPKEKIQSLESNKKNSILQPIDQYNGKSVLKLYFIDKLAPSTSSIKLTDDLLLKLKEEKRKKVSSKSRGKQRACASPIINNQVEKRKRRSKSRLTKEKHESKMRHEFNTDVKQQKLRKSTSDISKKRCLNSFDTCTSVEGKLESDQKKKIEKYKTDKHIKYRTKKISLSLSKTTFEHNRSKYSTMNSYWTEDVSSIMDKYLQGTFQKTNRKWSKSCTRKKNEFTCRYSDKDNKTKSDTSVGRKIPESKRSNFLIIKECPRPLLSNRSSVVQPSFKEKVYEDLYKLSTYQNIKPNNRFKVISKPIHKDSSTTNKNDENLVSTMKNYKLKPHPSSEKEKEAILNLPICRRIDMTDSSVKNTSKNISYAKQKRRNKMRMTNTFSGSTSEEEALKLLDETFPKRKKHMKKSLFRREVSFTHLNVIPVEELYRKKSKVSVIRASFSPTAKIERVNVALGKGFAYKSQKTQGTGPILFKKNVDDKLTERKTCNRKLSFFHLIPGEKILEISTRATGTDGKTTIGFTVSGTEPPKRLKCGNVEKPVPTKSCKLQMTFLPPTEVNDQNSGFENTVSILNPPVKSNEEYFKNPSCYEIVPSFVKVNEDVVKEMPLKFISSSNLRKHKASPLITCKGITKLGSYRKGNFRRKITSSRSLWRTGIHKANNNKLVHGNEAEKNNSFKYYEKCPHELEKKKEIKKEDDIKCFNNFKLCRFRQTKEKRQRKSKLSLLESPLQIIKEESHSTDSSRCKNRKAKKPSACTDIKNTQTDFDDDDITKMKEAINYLCSVIEQNKALNSKIETKTSEKYLQTEKFPDSSTETSSYEERFLKAANNKKPNSNSVKKTYNVKVKNEETKRCNKLHPITNISSSYENTSSTSNHKSLSTEQSSSAVALSSSYFQNCEITKVVSDSKEKIKTTFDKAVLTTIVSNLSTSEEFGETSGANIKVDVPNAVTKSEGIMFTDHEQNTSQQQFQNQPSDSIIISKTKSNTTVRSKKFEDKSLQTSDYIIPIMKTESILPARNTIYDCLYAEKNISNSSNSENNAIIEKISESLKGKLKKKKVEKPSSTFEKLKRVFGNKQQKHTKEKVMTYNISRKLDSNTKIIRGQPSPEPDYLNFIKFERHLEQVLGLYPSIFKTIKAQMDVTLAKNFDREIEDKNLFPSKSSLATTIDTVTEYKNTERFDKVACDNCDVNNDSLHHCCNCYHVWQNKYIVEQYMNSQNFGLRSRRQQKAYRKKIEADRGSKYDSTSSMKPIPKRVKKNRTNAKFENVNETCGLHSVISVYSNDKGFVSSCSSISLDEKWSVASPLYGRTTSSEDLTVTQRNPLAEKNISTSSQSLQINKITITSEGRKSKSLIEVSTKKSVNRKLTLKQLLNCNASIREQNNLMQVFAGERQPNIVLMSVSSSCTVFTTPSKFLAKVEKRLQFEKTPPPPEMLTKAVGDDLVNVNVSSNEIKCKPTTDERLYQKILFPNIATHLRVNAISTSKRQKPFYIHKPRENNSEQELDSLEIKSVVQSPQVQLEKEEDDFSADSLEIVKCPPKSCNYNLLYASTTYVKPANQTYLVYSNTIKYDKKLSKHNNRDKSSNSKHRKTDGKDKTQSVTNQDVSNTLTSESGYESTKSKRTASIRNFFRKGGSLLDMFRTKSTVGTQKVENRCTNLTSVNKFTSFSNLFTKKQANLTKKDAGTTFTKDKSTGLDNGNVLNKVYWHSISKDKKVSKHEKKPPFYKSGEAQSTDKKADAKSKCPEIKLFQTNPLSFSIKSYKKQKDECHAYAEKVLLESQLRKEGYYKQYKDFKEMPLELLIGKKMPCKSKCKRQQANFVQTSPTFTSMPIQTESSTKENKALVQRETFEPRTFIAEEKIILPTDVTKTKKVKVKEFEDDFITPSLNLNNRCEREMHLESTEQRKLPPLNGKIPLDINSTISKTEFDRSKLHNSEDLRDAVNVTDITDLRLETVIKNPENPNTKALEKSKSDGFQELYIKNSGHQNNSMEIVKFVQFKTKLQNEAPNDCKRTASEELESNKSLELHGGTTQTNAVDFVEATNFTLKSRSKTPEDTRSKSFKLYSSDHKYRNSTTNIAITTESASGTKLGNISSRICEESRSARSHYLFGSNSGHRTSIVNIVETTEFDLNSKKKTPGNFKSRTSEYLQSDKSPGTSEQYDTTVTVAEVNQFKVKSRLNRPKESKSKSSEGSSQTKSKSEYRSKSASKSSSDRKSKCTPEEIKHNCRCKLKSLDAITKELADEEPEPVRSVSSIVDVLVTNSVTKNIDGTEDVFKQTDESGVESEINLVESPQEEIEEVELPQEERRNVSEDFRKGLTDKEVFEKLLDSYEKIDGIAERLSKDEDFFNSQIDSLKKQSDQSFDERSKLARRSSRIYTDDHRSTHFWEEKMRQMRTKEDNPVKADDIGVCFARGFRPDNITLSGDACFNLNKQDRLTFSDKMLSDQESIIDFSERETPLDYLLALGFMVDEASNALKDEDIRSRLLAAITEVCIKRRPFYKNNQCPKMRFSRFT